MKKQRYELISGTSAKFWEVYVRGSSMTTTYGRVKTKGQSTVKKFPSPDAAKTAAEKLIAQKLKKGYTQTGGRKTQSNAKPATKKTAKKKTARKTAKKKVNVTKLGESAALKIVKLPDTSKADLKKLAGRFDRVDRALAKRDDLSAALLETLSHSSDRITRRNVAANPNCGPKTLLHLAPQFPGEFLANPQFDWMLIENPSRFHKLDQNVLMGMFKRQDCPEAFLRWAADHKSDEVKLALISNKQAPKDILERFARSRDKRIAEAAKAHEKLAGEISEDELEDVFLGAFRDLLKNDLSNERQRRYIGLAQFPYVALGERTAWVLKSDFYIDPTCPAVLLPSLLAKVSTSKSMYDRERVAKHPKCPAKVLAKLATDNDYRWDHDRVTVQEAVAKNPQCPAKVLAKLATGNSLNDWWLSKIHVAVAKHPNCPVNTLKAYQSQSDAEFRVAVAQNTSCPLEILRELAADDTKAVRAAVAANVDCPPSLLRKLAIDESVSVRQSVTRSPSCPAATLKKLAIDKDERVRKIVNNLQNNKAAKSPTEKSVNEKVDFPSLVEKLTYKNWSAIRKLLANENIPSHLRRKVFERMPDKGSEDVRMSAAGEWGSEWLRSRVLIRKLASDTRPQVRKVVACNSSCPANVYQQLLKDIDAGVRREAALNVQHPVNVRLLQSEPESSPWFLMQLEKEEKKLPGLTAAVREGNILFPAPKTNKALRGSSLVGRILALSQPDTPPAELARASGYRDWRQRMAIARNLATPTKVLEKLGKDSNRYVAAQADATLHRDEKARKALASRVAAQTASKATDVDYKLLSQWIGERLRKKAGEKWFHIRPAKLVSRPVEAWAAYVPLSEWWNPNSLSAGQIQKAWDQLYGSRAPKLVELVQQPPASKDKRLLEALAESRSCPRELLLKLSTNRSSVVRRAVAANPKCPTSVLETFVSSRDRSLRQAVASNRKCPPELFDTLASDDDDWVVYTLLESHSIPETIWNKLASHKDWISRITVARSSKCPQSAFKRLSVDKTASIRAAVAYNTQCPADILKVLANDGSSEVRCSVVQNEGTPADILEKLATDKDNEVRERLVSNSATPVHTLVQLAEDKDDWVRARVASHSYRLPLACIEKLARDKSRYVRREVADDPRLPVHCLKQLAKDTAGGDKGGSVLESVAYNPSCPPDLLETVYLSITNEFRVPNIILARADCPTDLVEIISQQDGSPSVRKRAKAELARRRKNA